MRLEGIHHVSCITGDARRNLDFYTRVLGLRLVAKSVNQDDPYVYHLFYADELGRPGSDLTFFEYPHAVPGRAGAGMIHRIEWRVASAGALAFWERRLAAEGVPSERAGAALRFADPEGLAHELGVDASPDEPRLAEHPEIAPEVALRGFAGVRAYAARAAATQAVLERVLGGSPAGEGRWEIRGGHRGGTYALDPAPAAPGRPGAGTVHHVAWATSVEEHPRWVDHLQAAGLHSTPVVDRYSFRSIYFREPGGVLFEIADEGPGFTRDMPLAELGTRVSLPPAFAARRAEIEARLTPLPDPRAGWKRPATR